MLYGTAMGVVRSAGLDAGLEAVAAAHFTQVELKCEDDALGVWRQDVPAMKRRLAALGLRAVSVHVATTGWDVENPDAAVRRAAVDAASRDFAVSAEVGARLAVVHPNHSTHEFTRADYAASVARSVESLGILAERAKREGMRLAVENMPHYGRPRPAGDFAELLSMIAPLGDHVGLCLDAGHAASNGLSPADEARVGGQRIFTTHLHDCSAPLKDDHVLPGLGLVDWPALIRALDAFAPTAFHNFEIRTTPDRLPSDLAALAALGRQWEGMRGS